MSASTRPAFRLLPILALAGIVAACAPAPIYKTGPDSVSATPTQVATSPANFLNLQVVWGGKVIGVRNFADHSEIEVLAYPLDSSQRPRLKQAATGRFIAIVPGFVEPMNFPPGSLITLHGMLDGSRGGAVGQADYTFALVRSDGVHRWTAEEMSQGHPNVSIGVGIGGWIR